MGLALFFVILYMTITPLALTGLRQLRFYLMQSIYRRRNDVLKQMYRTQSKWSIIKEYTRFTLKEDKRSAKVFKRELKATNSFVYIVIYVLGLLLSVAAGLLNNLSLFVIALIFLMTSQMFSNVTSKPILKKRREIIESMIIKKRAGMGLFTDGKGEVDPSNEIVVRDWGEDLMSPRSILLTMPPTFSPMSQANFMESWNEIFNSNGVWVSDMLDEEYPGFDFNAARATIRTVKPLPRRADWHEKYLFNEGIAWSFFPLAVGSENGVPIDVIGDTGEVESVHVLGFALNSEQQKLSGKLGVQLGPDTVSAPQVLISGGTGGGKALAGDTKIRVIRDE